jgi:uncharacterized repeat protein (TIGR01451 family)
VPRTLRRRLLLLPIALLTLVTYAWQVPNADAAGGPKIAVLGHNAIYDYLQSQAFDVTLVTDSDIATTGLGSYDAFVYTRDNDSTPGPSLSSGAAANVQSFVGSSGRVVLLNGDFEDTINPNFDGGTPDPDVEQLLSNSVTWAAEGHHGYIGEYTGAVAGLTSNADSLTPLGLIGGTAGALQNGSAEGTIVETAAGAASPITQGVDFPLLDPTNEISYGALVSGVDSSLVLATYSNPNQPSDGNPAIIALSRSADLSVTGGISADEGPIAGANETFHVTVTNVGGSNADGYSFTAPLPANTSFSDADATNTASNCTLNTTPDPDEITCDRSGSSLNPGASDSFDVVVGVDAGFTDPNDQAQLQLDGSIAPSGLDASADNDTGSSQVQVTSLADLEITKSVTTPVTTPANTVFANADNSKNLVTYTITLVNHGISSAHNVEVDDALSNNLENASYCAVPQNASTCTPGSSFTGSIGGEGNTLAPGNYSWIVVAHAKTSLRNGSITNHNTASVGSSTDPYGQATNSRNSSDVTNAIFTVPGAPTLNQATVGNTKVGLNWSAPFNTGGTPITSYSVWASPCPTTGPNPCAVLSGLSPAPNASGSTFSYFATGLTNNTAYTFTVKATNAVGDSDPSNGKTVTPNVSADTNQIVNNVGSVDTGFSGGAQGCATGVPTTDPRCKDIVGKWSLTDAKDNGQLVGLSAIPNNPANGGPGIDCLEFDFASNSIANDGECVGATTSDPFGKATLSTFPTNQTTLSVPHLEYSQYDASITTTVLGAPCLAIKTLNGNAVTVSTPDGLRPICTNPAFPNVSGRQTNICPEDTGWTKAKPCAYIYYDVFQIPGYDLTGSRPQACTTGANCGAAVIIGSSVQNGIRTGGQQRVKPWCSGKFPNFASLPCVFKAMWLNKSTGNGNNDIQWQEYVTGDPGTLKTG